MLCHVSFIADCIQSHSYYLYLPKVSFRHSSRRDRCAALLRLVSGTALPAAMTLHPGPERGLVPGSPISQRMRSREYLHPHTACS